MVEDVEYLSYWGGRRAGNWSYVHAELRADGPFK